MLLVGYSVLFFLDTAPLPEGIASFAATEFSLGSLSISASKGGAICLIIATCLSVLQKKLGKTLGHNIGGGKRLNAISTLLATIILSPFAAYSWFDASNVLSAGHWFHFFEALGFCVAVFMGVNYYVDSLIKPQLRSQQAMQFSLGSSFIACYILEVWSGELTISLYSLLAFGAICFGKSYIIILYFH